MTLREIWNNGQIPVIYFGKSLFLRLPLEEEKYFQERETFIWMRSFGRIYPRWSIKKCWILPKAWFSKVAKGAKERFGSVYVIQEYREFEKCAPSCWNAVGLDCQCSCLGKNHGNSVSGNWIIISETFALKWKGRTLSVRLIK